MRKIGHKIAKPFILHFLYEPDFAGFHGLFTGFLLAFHALLAVFSRCHYFRKSRSCALNFSSIGYLWGWDLARLSLTKIRPQN